jgi:hypothetical protein
MIVESYELADVRFRAVKERVVQGDLAPIDSLEAQTILQDRFVQLRQAEVGLVNARLMLSNYLWDANDTPLEIPETVVPSDFDATQRTWAIRCWTRCWPGPGKDTPNCASSTSRSGNWKLKNASAATCSSRPSAPTTTCSPRPPCRRKRWTWRSAQ